MGGAKLGAWHVGAIIQGELDFSERLAEVSSRMPSTTISRKAVLLKFQWRAATAAEARSVSTIRFWGVRI